MSEKVFVKVEARIDPNGRGITVTTYHRYPISRSILGIIKDASSPNWLRLYIWLDTPTEGEIIKATHDVLSKLEEKVNKYTKEALMMQESLYVLKAGVLNNKEGVK